MSRFEPTPEDADFRISKGSLWTHQPIPAQQVLARAKEYNAQRVLLALTSHLGIGKRVVKPSYKTIAAVSGVRNQNTIKASLDVLEDYGFIKIHRFRDGKKNRQKYYIQDACWRYDKMNKLGRKHLRATGRCLACLRYVHRSEMNIFEDLRVHFGCGGVVILVVERDLPEKQIPWSDRKSGRQSGR
jgi:hypothetical protein